jgi:hypothetical protein
VESIFINFLEKSFTKKTQKTLFRKKCDQKHFLEKSVDKKQTFWEKVLTKTYKNTKKYLKIILLSQSLYIPFIS